ncbi:hypothetical protein PUNSTDRAFT_56352 [Punctularia strigosozonata HHB-11173 SS5]|uniref:uncharacterized protein n=1 Tax=Punctularia strigosozonata (strain HHB-11173) TaxID=741275 RepID=UPI0004416D2C|nr:uncharacterized protein PUNSTDRAFT_56352 [Punctularia strigosozonata HHB-11173 SS5]EIN13143.1 hypothetical protein PUNSTDRAFT_56352 [Punctularia strigosozonata HHB-11173 SS5]
MSGLSSFLPSRLLGAGSRSAAAAAAASASSSSSTSTPATAATPTTPGETPLDALRFAMETMPGARKHFFLPSTRAEILAALYDALWGPYAHLFLPNSNSSLPMHALLSDVQAKLRFGGAGDGEAAVPGRPCGHIFKKGQSCFRCKECALDDSCVMCSKCFHATDHSGHNISFFVAQQSGGSCDCGDTEAWRHPINCPHHPPLPPDAGGPSTSTLASMLASKPAGAPKSVWAADVPPVSNYPLRASVPAELHTAMSRTIGYALDFVLDTLDVSPDEVGPPASEADLRLQPTSDPLTKDVYCVVLWNDDKHSFDEVIQLAIDTTGRPRAEAAEIARRVDELGRDVLECGNNVPRLLETARTFAQVDLGVTVRRAHDTFREQMAAVIVEWLLDLTRARVGTDTLMLREIIAAELLSPRRRRDAAEKLREHSKLIPDDDGEGTARIDWLFLYHAKLWKRPRLSLKEMYASILSISPDHKMAIAVRFGNIYPRIIDAYLLIDREAETSIKYFALQLFTVPSVAAHLVQHHQLATRILSIVSAFFTNQIADKRVLSSSSASAAGAGPSAASLDVDAFPFKSKRFMPVFSDLRCLCHNAPVQRLIASTPAYLAHFARTCQLFMCVNPNKRAAASHVEYETDAWISVFNVTLSLSRVIKVYGEAFAHGTAAQLLGAVETVLHYIMLGCTLSPDRQDRTRFAPVAFHDVEFGRGTYHICEFDVLEGWVSFHHSLHWLLAELFKHVHLLGEERFARELGYASIGTALAQSHSQRSLLTVVDFPLRVLAMVAQIRVGLWVRNGFAIRGQLLHYRDFMLRELCYDQDIYVLQTALILIDPDVVLVSVLDRFQLLNYFSGITLHEAYEEAQLSGMVEEALYVIVTILTEGANAKGLSLPDAIRREVVHALAVGPCTFTDLVKRVAERMVDDVAFEHVLREVAHFRPPESNLDAGTYELRPECFDEVDPFFYHYTRNKREEVEAILRARIKKRTGEEDPVLVPRPTGMPASGPFARLPLVFESPVMLQIAFFAVDNVLASTQANGSTPPSAEAILDQTLHLVMVALVERGASFARLAAETAFAGGRTVVDAVCALEAHDKYKTYKARAGWILDRLAEHVREAVASRRKAPDGEDKAKKDGEDAKKRAAKARQEAIMRQMKAQQASFADNFEDVDDEDDEMADAAGAGAEEAVSFGTCIVCQEDLNTASKAFGALGMLQPSRVVRRQASGSAAAFNEVLAMPHSLDRAAQHPQRTVFPPPENEIQSSKPASNNTFEGYPSHSTRFGLHASVCSHMMHLDCFNVYSLSMRQRHRSQATRNHPESLARKEYICPLCKSLGNVMLPISVPSNAALSTVPFTDWIRASGISILKSKPDPLMESLQFKMGTGEFVFWSAQDPGYITALRNADKVESMELHKIVDTVMATAKVLSSQTRHLRDRPEPEQGERGAGLYLPEDLVGYTIASMEVMQRGTGAPGTLIADNLTEPQTKMIRGLVSCLTKLAALQFKGRPDEGREAVRHAVIKRLLPEWSRATHAAFAYPLILRDPFTLLVESAAVAPEMLRHILTLTYYACLAKAVIGIVQLLQHRNRNWHHSAVQQRQHEGIFGDLRMFFMSVVRHSPMFEGSLALVFRVMGEPQMEKLLYAFTLPFLRKAAILCRAMLPNAFPTPAFDGDEPSEYARLLSMLGIPPLSDLPNQDALQNALSGWCAHYGHMHGTSSGMVAVYFDYPAVYRIAKLPLVLDNLFEDKALSCSRCNTAPSDAAICLICGTVVCMQSHCCIDQEAGRGECNMHTRECGGAVGIYFCVKRCSLLYLYAGNGTFVASPYLDVHGEVDMSMRRGRRQFLHHARWEEIRKLWLSHGIPTLVARKLESTVDNGGWETL